jgi:hypothetical protein
MSILDLIRAPAKTTDALRKLEQLKSATPLAAKPDLQRRPDEALLAGDDAKAAKLEAEIAQCDRDDRRRELGIAETMRELAEAEQAEHAAELKRLRQLALAAKRKAADQYARYEKAADEVFAALDAIDELQATVDNFNSVAPQSEQLTSLNFDARGGRPAEQRVERSRRVLGTF